MENRSPSTTHYIKPKPKGSSFAFRRVSLPPPPFVTSSSKLLLLKISKRYVRAGSKSKSQFKAHITTVIGGTDQLADRADVPDLGHAHDGADDAKAESPQGGDAGRQFLGLVVVFGMVAAEAALEDEVFG